MMIVYKTTLKPYFQNFHQEERKKKKKDKYDINA